MKWHCHVRWTNIDLSILMIITNQRTSIGAAICMSCVCWCCYNPFPSNQVLNGFTPNGLWEDAVRIATASLLQSQEQGPYTENNQSWQTVNLCIYYLKFLEKWRLEQHQAGLQLNKSNYSARAENILNTWLVTCKKTQKHSWWTISSPWTCKIALAICTISCKALQVRI